MNGKERQSDGCHVEQLLPATLVPSTVLKHNLQQSDRDNHNNPVSNSQRRHHHNVSLLYKANRFNVTLCLFNISSEKMSKCGKNNSDSHSVIALCTTCLFLLHFDIICDLLLNSCTARWNIYLLNSQRNTYLTNTYLLGGRTGETDP